ncbi:MAG: hypothetical protein HWN69_08950 [Desulfobacterales bacterium]|nr:hypothetical protein [Desulfobacterales bacterium]
MKSVIRTITVLIVLNNLLMGSFVLAEQTSRQESQRVPFMKTIPRFEGQELPPQPVLVMDDGRAMVPAQRIWSDTGIDVTEGQTITVSADGQVRGSHGPTGNWALGPWGPEGTMSEGSEYEGNKVCALIGKVEGSEKGEEFYIGKELTFKAPLSGRFYLGVSDIFHLDNEGAFVVDVRVDGKRIDFGTSKPSKLEVLEVKEAKAKGKVFIDLDPYATKALKAPHGDQGNDLPFEPGVQRIGDSDYRIGKAMIQLAGEKLHEVPEKVEGIKVGLKFKKLNFLHATGWGAGPYAVADGTHIGSYVIHYEDESTTEIPIKYGTHVRDWWAWDSSEVSEGKVAWTGSNRQSRIRLYSMTWKNPHPDKVVTEIDYTSTGTVCAPFLVAVTAETNGRVPSVQMEKGTAEDRPIRPETAKHKRYEQTFSDLHRILGWTYPCLGLKGIDWQRVGEELLPRAKEVQTDEEFGLLCMELVARLEDSHAYLMLGTARIPTIRTPRWDPGFACLLDEREKPVVYYVDKGGPAETAGVKVGMTVLSINGELTEKHMEKRMEDIRKYTGYSSERYLRYHVAQWLPRQMNKEVIVQLDMQDVDDRTHTFELPATLGTRYLPRRPVQILGTSDSADVSWTRLENNIGYIYVRRIKSDLIPKLDQAVGELKDSQGLIVDVRGNSGGGYDSRRSHRNFALHDDEEPNRPRYKGPIALLIDARCISAGEGWASWFIAMKRARVFGEATAGASSRKTFYTLTNGLFKVRYPVKAYRGFLQRPIERRGLEPDVAIRQNARDLATGRDTVLEAAKRYLLEQTVHSPGNDLSTTGY